MNVQTTILTALLLAPVSTAALAASVYQRVDVNASADKVWTMIGPFCSIKDWHPAIGACTKSGDVRTLTTKDGKAHFVEKQTDRKQLSYTYAIVKSPLPISEYKSTIKVLPRGDGTSTVEWSSTYKPDSGKEQAAETAITGIYKSGLDNIQKTAAR